MFELEVSMEEYVDLIRKRKGLDLATIASKMGMSCSAIHNRIHGQLPMSDDEMKRLGKILGVDLH